MLHEHRHLLDYAAAGFAGLAAFSFWQGVALALTIVAAAMSIVLGMVRLHDRFRYGPDPIRKAFNDASHDFAKEAGEK